MLKVDFVVIGGGSAGLKAARTAARLGRSVAIAEERELGGECFWAGCVPTKAMVRAAQVWHLVRQSAQFGIHTDIRKADFADAMAYKTGVIARMSEGGAEDAGLSKLGAKYYKTRARFESPNEVRMGADVVQGKCILVATGSIPAVPPIPGLEAAGYITNREAVALTTLPKRLVVIGGGPIGLEFAQIFRRFGSEVTVLEKSEQILPREDRDIARLAKEYLEEEGIHIRTRIRVVDVTKVGSVKRVCVQSASPGTETDVRETIDCEEILVATGRAAATEGLNLEVTGVAFTESHLSTDPYLRTSVAPILAAGDICGGYQFTHVASYEGKLAAMNAFTDKPQPFDHRVVPRCTYIDPEVGSIGLTEQEAREQGLAVTTQSFSFADLDRAIIYGQPKGLVKLVVDELDGQIRGAHIIGPDASSILAELTLCMKHHLPVSAIADTMHAYPSFPEAVEAAALAAPNFRGQVEGAMDTM